MKGLELSEKYYWEVARPIFEKKCPHLIPRMAIGLYGDGSECLGFDDCYSWDHDFGPGFCIWLSSEDFKKYGSMLQDIYQKLPKAFLGFPARIISSYGTDRIGVMEITEFFRRYIGNEQPPDSLIRWLSLPEYKLAAVTSGKIFEDSSGNFQKLQNALSYYPEDVRLKKIAAKVAKIAQSGQYNYSRCMIRKDYVAANFALQEFLKHTISIIYLLNKKYAPYYKWSYHGLSKLPILQELREALEQLVLTKTPIAAWDTVSDLSTLNLKDQRVRLIEDICDKIADELQQQQLIWKSDHILNRYPEEIQNKIQDPQLRTLPVLID